MCQASAGHAFRFDKTNPGHRDSRKGITPRSPPTEQPKAQHRHRAPSRVARGATAASGCDFTGKMAFTFMGRRRGEPREPPHLLLTTRKKVVVKRAARLVRFRGGPRAGSGRVTLPEGGREVGLAASRVRAVGTGRPSTRRVCARLLLSGRSVGGWFRARASHAVLLSAAGWGVRGRKEVLRFSVPMCLVFVFLCWSKRTLLDARVLCLWCVLFCVVGRCSAFLGGLGVFRLVPLAFGLVL